MASSPINSRDRFPENTGELIGPVTFRHAIESLEKQAASTQKLIRLELAGTWIFIGCLCVAFAVVLAVYNAAKSAAALADIYPFSPNLISLYLIFIPLIIMLWAYIRWLMSLTDTAGRLDLRDKLEAAGVAEDLANNRIDYTGILRRDFGPSCAWRFSLRRKPITTLEDRLNLLAGSLFTYLNHRHRNILLNHDYTFICWIIIAAAIWVTIDYLAPDDLTMLFYLVLFPVLSLLFIPCRHIDAVAFEELARHLRTKLG